MERSPGISYCRLLLYDSLLKDDNFRTENSDTSNCDCGVERETAEHFLLHCSFYSQSRNDIFDQILQSAQIPRSPEISRLPWIYYFLHFVTRSAGAEYRHQRAALSVFSRNCSWTVNPVHHEPTRKLYTSGVFIHLGLQHLSIYCWTFQLVMSLPGCNSAWIRPYQITTTSK